MLLFYFIVNWIYVIATLDTPLFQRKGKLEIERTTFVSHPSTKDLRVPYMVPSFPFILSTTL